MDSQLCAHLRDAKHLEWIEDLLVQIFYDLICVCLTRHIIATSMYVHANPTYVVNSTLSRTPPGPERGRFDLTDDWEALLEFILGQKSISMAEHSCWHALVKEHLSACQQCTNFPAPREIDVWFAQFCLGGKIGKVQRHLDG